MALLTTARWYAANKKVMWGAEVNEALLTLLGEKLGFPAPGFDEADAFPIAPLPDVGSDHLIALCLGHARRIDEGNVGAGGISEEEFNRGQISLVAARLRRAGYKVAVIYDYPADDYYDAMVWLAGHLKKIGATLAVEFHFNAYNGEVRGHEVLHWESSKRGVELARCINESLDNAFPDHPARGMKPRTYKDRGALFMSKTHCPAVIIEPFFGDNQADWDLFSSDDGEELLADAIAAGIHSFTEGSVV